LAEIVVLSIAWSDYTRMIGPLAMLSDEIMQCGHTISTAEMSVGIDHNELITRHGWDCIRPTLPPIPDLVRVSGRVRTPVRNAWRLVPASIGLSLGFRRKDADAGISQPETRNQIFLDDIICLVVMRDIEWHRAKVLYKGHANPMITYGTTYKPS